MCKHWCIFLIDSISTPILLFVFIVQIKQSLQYSNGAGEMDSFLLLILLKVWDATTIQQYLLYCRF